MSSRAFCVHFQTLFLMCFWIHIKLSFQWGVRGLYLKKWLYAHFLHRPWSTSDPWHLKKWCHGWPPMATFGKCTKKINFYIHVYVPQENKIRMNINPEDFLQKVKQEFPCQNLKVSPENLTTWLIKSLASSLKLCTPNRLAQITVLEATKMKQKSSVADWVYKNGATVKNLKRCQPV